MAYERFQFVEGTNGRVAIYHPYWKKYLKCDGKKIKTSNDKYDFTVTKHGDNTVSFQCGGGTFIGANNAGGSGTYAHAKKAQGWEKWNLEYPTSGNTKEFKETCSDFCDISEHGHSCGSTNGSVGYNIRSYPPHGRCCRSGRYMTGGPCVVNKCPGVSCSQEGQYCTDHGGKICRKGKWVSQTNNTYKEEPWHPEYDKGGHATSGKPSCNQQEGAGWYKKFIHCDFKNSTSDYESCRDSATYKAYLGKTKKLGKMSKDQCLTNASRGDNFTDRASLRKGSRYSGGGRQWNERDRTCYSYAWADTNCVG